MESDTGAERFFFRAVEFDRSGNKQFGPSLMESDRYDLASRLLEIIPAGEIKVMGEKVRKGKHGRQKARQKGYSFE